MKEFQLYDRIVHVFSEAQRVYDFRDACDLPSDRAFERIGQLMNDSHFSCKDMYECSCEELDDLTDVCRKAGAYGSRLTGWFQRVNLSEFFCKYKGLLFRAFHMFIKTPLK